MKHTPGPWKAERDRNGDAIVTANGDVVCVCCIHTPNLNDDGTANAEVIASALDTNTRVDALEAAFKQLLQWRILGRAAVLALDPQSPQSRGYIQGTDMAIEDIKRAAGQCGIDIE